jgi:dipeptidyl aminopeptidase/acylaminoacyl peptidase
MAPSTHTTHKRRLLKLGAFALLASLLAYLAVQTALAWGYASLLTHPPCSGVPAQITGLPSPQPVQLETPDGLALDAWYYPPTNGAVLLALGGPCGALGESLPPMAFLLQAGFGALQIDSRSRAQPRAAVTLGGNEVLDVQAGLNFLAARPEVEAIGAIGYSMGGVTAIRATARFSQIEALVAEGGFYNLGEDIVEPQAPKFPLRSLFLHSIALAFQANSGLDPWAISPIDDLAAISPRPVLLIYGEGEAASGRARAQYQAARQPKELWIVPGGAHGRNHQAAPHAYEQRVLQFFTQHLLERP